jgi:hypothetical protein
MENASDTPEKESAHIYVVQELRSVIDEIGADIEEIA